MKIISQQEYKAVKAFGCVFDSVPRWANFITVDRDGFVFAHLDLPKQKTSSWYTKDAYAIATVNLQGADWRECIAEC